MVKNIVALVLSLFCMIGLVGCVEEADDLKQKFPEYYNLDTFKGIEVYVWHTDDGEYRCGAMTGTNRNKTYEEISNLAKNGATIEEMKTILSSYNIGKEEIIIIPIKINSTDFEIDFEMETAGFASEVFWES